MTTNHRRRTSEEIRNRVLELSFSGINATQIQKRLVGELRDSSHDIPDLRTIQRIVKAFKQPKTRERLWSFGRSEEASDSKIILDTLGEVVVGTDGRVDTLTTTQAEWLLKIRKSTETLSAWGAWILYKLSVEGNDYDSSGLDILLAIKPWMDERRASELQKLIDSGSIPAPSCWSFIKTRSELMKNGIFGGNGGNQSER